MLTIGVEEEFFVVDPRTRDLALQGIPNFEELEGGDIRGFDREFQEAVVESRTGVCEDLSQVRTEVQDLRKTLARAASEGGLSVVSAGTLPTADWRIARTTKKVRYEEISQHYHDVVHRRLTCGCHVHIGIKDRDLAVQVLNRVLDWLPSLLAISASSPFYEGFSTGYQSYRSLLWGGFPVAGPPPVHNSHTQYVDTIQTLIKSGAILDEGHVYWDVRLGIKFNTLEFRIADACTDPGDTVLQAGLCRALVLTCMREIENGLPHMPARPELLRAATWKSARSGLNDALIDVRTGELMPADVLLRRLLEYLEIALRDLGDWDTVRQLTEKIRRQGTSAQRQCRAFASAGRLECVVDRLIKDTVPAG
ncbi:glutamate--cysteine ligase [Streptomyces sp. NL15-2K]|uniref:carboxylate-amine ligase n=1 Tax=Streptomyces sp. NL15-2K TaxID=376149 RepID=UPI000F57CE4D|nr:MULTISPECIES: glutamate--cysteine ligase [Actinomycetes]WKX13530.1 glutamate--cysteine ligase [Kutzneria buriramensis]